MLDDSEFVSFLQAVVFFIIELVIDKLLYNALICDCPSNDQKLDSEETITELYNSVMKTTVKNPLPFRLQFVDTSFIVRRAHALTER